ncbi:unnamed protein product [marine sediment metagenome]|uniref:Uncharacterized protein n=1 Tax=marine sediment metagenome TaxID=412755 RepID=X1ELF9_9ZZZZ
MGNCHGFHGKKVSTKLRRAKSFERESNLARKVCIYCKQEFKYSPTGNFCSRKCMAKYREEFA